MDLTPREREILELVAEGLTNGEIGTRLHLSRNTVKNHLVRLMEKMCVDNRTKLAVQFIQIKNAQKLTQAEAPHHIYVNDANGRSLRYTLSGVLAGQ